MGQEIVIGVPGFWESREEFQHELEAFQSRFRLEGDYFVKEGGSIPLRLDWYERDDGLATAFRYASQGTMDEALLAEINEHTHTAYVVCPVQSPAAVGAVVEVSRALFATLDLECEV